MLAFKQVDPCFLNFKLEELMDRIEYSYSGSGSWPTRLTEFLQLDSFKESGTSS